ncbi:GNAT family N-acetyltransferase [Sulfitobacter sp. S0837]|uniref:GNAT family N-acetyltransferase n=1 Tax=Sulfitobacter maritimus TaxID=2741719 RepID=UPI001583ED73|nr:GNAT family N-acetyltransferase [Sulfitobacter maritimus]
MSEEEATLRRATAADYDRLGVVMFDAIHNGPGAYDTAQRVAWLPTPPEGERWAAKLAPQDVILAERAGQMLGFMAWAGGYIDLAFVAASAQRQGVFRALYGRVEAEARAAGLTALRVHASLMARPAFEAMGFHVIAAERVARAGAILDRFEMEKTLT